MVQPTAYERHIGQWLLIASAKDEPVSIRPFAVTLSLGDLWAGRASVQLPA